MIATSQPNISQQCWPSICKLWPHDRNISMQQIVILLGTTSYTRVAHMLWHVASWKSNLCACLGITLLHKTWPNDYNIMQHLQMLHGKFDHFQIWANDTQHVATCHNRVAKHLQHVAPNNVATCCVEMLWSFRRGLKLTCKMCDTLHMFSKVFCKLCMLACGNQWHCRSIHSEKKNHLLNIPE